MRLMTTYAVIDLSNLFHRCRHGMGDLDTKIGMGFHIIFRSLRKLYRELKVDHMVFAIDQGSWRYAVYPAYKSRRRLEQTNATPSEQEENTAFLGALRACTDYLDKQTRCTVLQSPNVEADDFIGRWISRHPEARNIIVSGDSDFVQLVSENVQIFDAMNQRLISHDKVTDEKNQMLEFNVSQKDGKVKVGKPNSEFIPEADWPRKALFLKLIRGDVGDSIFSAFPGVRYEGKNHSIRSAWDDRQDKGYSWNNLMFQTWDKLTGSDPSGKKLTETVRVIDQYRINESLIDLTKQPENVVTQMDEAIDEAIARTPPQGIGMQFLKFCKRYDLPALEKEAEQHIQYLNAGYK